MNGADGETIIPRLRPVEARQIKVSGRPMVCLFDPTGLSPEPVYLSPDLFFVACLFDGQRSSRDVQVSYMRQYGDLLFTDRIRELVDRLDQNLFLQSARYRDFLESDRSSFKRASTRRATHAGSAYPADPRELSTALDRLIESGRRDVPRGIPEGAVLEGAVLPHIDLERGAPVYGATYATLSALDVPPTIVILGTAHAGLSEKVAVTRKAFETPLGKVTTDDFLLDRLLQDMGPKILKDEYVHKREHSIEIQLVFLQHLFAGRGTFRIVPILCGSVETEDDEMDGFAATLARARQSSAERSAVLASVDLAHLGPQFGDRDPVGPGLLEMCEREDRVLLEKVSDLDAGEFLQSATCDGNRRRICGVAPTYLLLRTIEASSCYLARYHQAVDRMGFCMVSFAGMVFCREA